MNPAAAGFTAELIKGFALGLLLSSAVGLAPALADGDTDRARSRYIKLRAAQINDALKSEATRRKQVQRERKIAEKERKIAEKAEYRKRAAKQVGCLFAIVVLGLLALWIYYLLNLNAG